MHHKRHRPKPQKMNGVKKRGSVSGALGDYLERTGKQELRGHLREMEQRREAGL